MPEKKFQPRYNAAEKQRIVEAVRAAAVAEAELWDTLRDIESDRHCSIETDIHLISSLAGDCSRPPTFSDLTNENVWETFKIHSIATR
jgi:hypothetical protein